MIKYPQSITKEKTLNNTSEAFELSANNHGVDQWWVLVRKLNAASGPAPPAVGVSVGARSARGATAWRAVRRQPASF